MAAVVQDITAEQGAALAVTLTGAGASLQGRTLRMHVRSKVGVTTTKLVASTTDGRLTIGGSPYTTAALAIDADIMAAVSITLPVEYWVYDVESYTTAADVRREWSGRFTVSRDVTRDTEATADASLSGAVLYSGPQSLTTAQQLQARENIGAGTGGGGGGSGDVVGPASATDDRIAAFDGVTGKLIKQGGVTATAVASHLGSTSNPHSVTAAQAGADPTGTAAAAVVAHTGATDPHGDRAYADGLAGNYAAAGHNHSGTYQPLATALTNTTAAFTTAQETKLSGIETAADVTDAGNVGTAIDGATAKTTPVDADTVPLIDSAASNVLKKLSWANIKATAKTYFDTLYQAILVSGTSIKTINSTSLLGSGDIAISATPAGSGTELQYRNGSAFGAMTGTAWDDTNRAETRTGATVTTSNPIQSFTQTWNSAGVTFTGWKLNVTNTASAAASLLADWQVGGVSKAGVRKDGRIVATQFSGSAASDEYGNITVGPYYLYMGHGNGSLGSQVVYMGDFHSASPFFNIRNLNVYGSLIGFGAASQPSGTLDVYFGRDAANVLAQRNTTNAQTFRVYGTYTDASNYERGFIRFNAGTMEIGNEFAGSGSARSIRIVQSGGSYADGIILQVNSTTNLSFYGYGLFNGSGLYSSQSALTVTTPDAIGFSANAAHTSVKAGGAWVYAGNNANGGNVYLDGGAGYGTGTDGDVIVGNTKGNLVVRGGLICESQFRLKSYTVATLPSAATAGALIYVTDETGGATVAFSDGTNWRRVTDRSVCA